MRLTISEVLGWKQQGRKWTMLTAYEYATARALDEAGIPVILVGDSLGRVLLGYENTIPVTLDDMIRAGSAVVRGTRRSIVVIDMPYMTFQISPDQALENAGRLIQEGGAQSVKLEGGAPIAETVQRLTDSGIPVMGHLGYTPQSIHQEDSTSASGYTPETARQLINDAVALEEAGAWSMVLDLVPSSIAKIVTDRVSIPIVGVGSGPHCDAQGLIISDVFGLFAGEPAYYAKRYAELGTIMIEAVSEYIKDVDAGEFPKSEHSIDAKFDEATLESLKNS